MHVLLLYINNYIYIYRKSLNVCTISVLTKVKHVLYSNVACIRGVSLYKPLIESSVSHCLVDQGLGSARIRVYDKAYQCTTQEWNETAFVSVSSTLLLLMCYHANKVISVKSIRKQHFHCDWQVRVKKPLLLCYQRG